MKNEDAKVKKTPKGLIIGIVAAVAIIAIAIVLVVLKPWAGGYVATVDNLKITKQEYMVFSKFNMSQFLTSIPNNTITVDKYDWNTTVTGETAKDQVKKSTLDNIQEIKIQLIKAKEAGLTLDATDLKGVDDVIAQRITDSGTKVIAEKSIMDAYGVSLADYKEVYKDLVLTQKYITTERNKVTVAETDVKKYYDDNKKEFDKVTVTQILITTVDANGAAVTAGKKSEAKKKAEDLLARVKAGEDIKVLAVANSDDKPAVTENKGEYTLSKNGQMVPEFENWAFSTHAIGDVGIVETSYGYHIMKFDKRVESTYAEVQESIKTSLISSKFSEAFTKTMDGWKKEPLFAVKENISVINKIDKSIYGV
ncbi:MAG TPA: peptidylprolyl isomerase [Ruminiclostridium sp.]